MTLNDTRSSNQPFVRYEPALDGLRAMSVIVAVVASRPRGFPIPRWSSRARSTRGPSKRSKRLIGFETDKSLSGSYHSLMKIWIKPRYASAVFTH